MTAPVFEGWHLTKQVSVGHLLTTAVVAVSAVVWLTSIEKQTEKNQESIERLIQVVDKHVISGPHAEAAVRLTRLEVITEQLIQDQRETQKILRDIRDNLQSRSWNGPGQ